MSGLYGNVYDPKTGQWLASVADGRLQAKDGRSYKLDGDKILSDRGEVLGYLSVLSSGAEGSGSLANKLFST